MNEEVQKIADDIKHTTAEHARREARDVIQIVLQAIICGLLIALLILQTMGVK